MDFENSFDVIFLIYDDFGALTNEERKVLLKRVFSALKPEGRFVFDVRAKLHFDRLKEIMITRECPQGGFWQKNPYFEVKEVILYPEVFTDLARYIITSEDHMQKIYHVWNRS